MLFSGDVGREVRAGGGSLIIYQRIGLIENRALAEGAGTEKKRLWAQQRGRERECERERGSGFTQVLQWTLNGRSMDAPMDA